MAYLADEKFGGLFHIHHSKGGQFSPFFMRLIIWSLRLDAGSNFPSIKCPSNKEFIIIDDIINVYIF
jgi:hypothetical protein